jgi:hypothetical protein
MYFLVCYEIMAFFIFKNKLYFIMLQIYYKIYIFNNYNFFFAHCLE